MQDGAQQGQVSPHNLSGTFHGEQHYTHGHIPVAALLLPGR
jgi:hypothetical protein